MRLASALPENCCRGKTGFDPSHCFIERDALDGGSGREGGQQTRRCRRRKQDEVAMIIGLADQATKGLREAGPDDAVIIIHPATGKPSRFVQYVWPWPRHLFHDDKAQRMAGHIDPIAQGIGAEQAGVRIIAEDIDQRAGIHRIDMLGIEREAITRQTVGNPGVHAAQAADRCEQP